MSRESLLRRGSRRLLHLAVRRGRPTGTPWGEALIGEFEETTTWEGVRWVLSGLPIALNHGLSRRAVIARRFAYAAVLGTVTLVVLQAFVATSVYVPSASNSPTIQIGDRLLVQRVAYTLHYGDMVEFHMGADHMGLSLRRVVGLPGDIVDCADGQLRRNGTAVDEPYLPAGAATDCERVTVPAGAIYVLGDARDVAVDSRTLGVVEQSAVEGRVVGRYWPLDRVGPVEGRSFSMPSVKALVRD